MGRVMILCPRTSKPVPTGAVMERASLEATTLTAIPLPDPCPKCGTFHEWSSEDAWVEES